MRISDWSSDVCSSDLRFLGRSRSARGASFAGSGALLSSLPNRSAMLSGYRTMLWRTRARATLMHDAQIGVGERLIYLIPAMFARAPVSCSPRSAAAFGIFAIMLKRVGELRDGSGADQIGRASCRERVCQYV